MCRRGGAGGGLERRRASQQPLGPAVRVTGELPVGCLVGVPWPASSSLPSLPARTRKDRLRSHVMRFAVGVVLVALTAALGIAVNATTAQAATYKWVSNYIYNKQNPNYRIWAGAYIATSNDGSVNN